MQFWDGGARSKLLLLQLRDKVVFFPQSQHPAIFPPSLFISSHLFHPSSPREVTMVANLYQSHRALDR